MLNKLITTVALILAMISGTVAATPVLEDIAPCVYTETVVKKAELSRLLTVWHKGARPRFTPNKVYYSIGDVVRFQYTWKGLIVRGRVKACKLRGSS